MLKATTHSIFKAGQIWSYRTRPYETGSTLIVVKTEVDDNDSKIVHIHLQGLRMKNPHHKLGISSIISHLPCSEAAISESVRELLQENVSLPAYEDGYQQWRAAFDRGMAGVWDIPIAQMVDAMESVLNQAVNNSE